MVMARPFVNLPSLPTDFARWKMCSLMIGSPAALVAVGLLTGCTPDSPWPAEATTAFEPAPAAAAEPATAVGSALSDRLGEAARLDVRRQKAIGAWTFQCGRPVTPTGEPVDYAVTALRDRAEAGLIDDNACALVQRTDAGYVVRELSVGDTDAPFVDWPARHGIPAAIIETD